MHFDTVKCTHKLSLRLSYVHFVTLLTSQISLHHPVTLLLTSCGQRVPSSDIQLITRLQIAELYQVDNLCLIGRTLMDCKFQELAELLVELLSIFLLDDVCKLFNKLFPKNVRGHSRNLVLPQSLQRDARKKIL